MINPAEHTGLVGYLMGKLQVRKRFQKADADDIEGDMMLALCVAAKNYRDRGGKFSYYATPCIKPIAAAGNVKGGRFRKRSYHTRDGVVTKRMLLFSEIGDGFTRSKYFATTPPAEHELEESERVACDAAEVERMLNGLSCGHARRAAEIVRMRFGIDRWDELTLERIGQHFGITRERVRLIEAKTLREMRDTATAQLEAV